MTRTPSKGRHGAKWTPEERKRLMRALHLGGVAMAAQHFTGERTPGAVRRYAYRLGFHPVYSPGPNSSVLVSADEVWFALGYNSRATALDWMKRHPERIIRNRHSLLPQSALDAELARIADQPKRLPDGYVTVPAVAARLGRKVKQVRSLAAYRGWRKVHYRPKRLLLVAYLEADVVAFLKQQAA